MTIALAGILDLRGDRQNGRDLVARALAAQNFGKREAFVDVVSAGPLTMGRIAFEAEWQSQNLPGDIAQRDGRILCGDFQLYGPQADLHVVTGENASLRAGRIEAWLLEQEDPIAVLGRSSGDFSAAFWRDGCLSLITDPMGVRPIVYAHAPGGYLAFATVPAGILAMGLFKPKAEPARISDALTGHPQTRTAIAGIQMLKMGSVLSLSAQELEIERYFDLASLRSEGPVPSFPDAAKHLNGLIRNAVTARLSRFGKSASHLSSGLDSGAVAMAALDQLESQSERLIGLTLEDRFFHPELMKRGESWQVNNLVQQRGGIDLEKCSLPEGYVQQPLDCYAGTTITATDRAPDLGMGQAAIRRGADVILTGLGGDEASSSSGKKVFVELLGKGRLRQMLKTAREIAAARGWQTHRVLAHDFLGELAPGWLRRRSGRSFSTTGAVLDAMRGTVSKERFAQLMQKTKHLRGASTEKSFRAAIFERGHLQAKLLEYAHRSLHQGIGYAHPLLDREIITFTHQLPVTYFVQNGHRRALFRAAVSNLLPDDFRLQAKKAAPGVGTMLKTQKMLVDFRAEAEAISSEYGRFYDGIDLDWIRNAFAKDLQEDQALAMDQAGTEDQDVVQAQILLGVIKEDIQLRQELAKDRG